MRIEGRMRDRGWKLGAFGRLDAFYWLLLHRRSPTLL
jgi:hypothetical protein